MNTRKISFVKGAILFTGLGLFLISSNLALAADSPASEKALQGVWRGARFDLGKGEDLEKGVKLEMTIKDNHISCKRLPEGQSVGEGELKISADGKTIDAVGSTGNFKGKNFFGILKLEGETLTWCTTSSGKAEDRPAEFVADKTKKNWLIVVKREAGKG